MSVKATLNGIDISHHQSGLGLANVHADFVIIKATEGVGYTDPKFHDFANAAKQAGKLRGFYHFARADLDNTAEREADWFLSVVAPQLDGETILVLDWEAGSIKYGPGWAKAWLARVQAKTGITPLIYLSLSVTREYDWSTVATLYPLWLAAYGRNAPTAYKATQPPSPGHWSAPTVFQYGSQGRLAGYTGDIDLNNAYVNAAGWKKLAGKESAMAASSGMVSPVQGRLTQPFRRTNAGLQHGGMDIGTSGKLSKVYAAFSGVVRQAISWAQPGNRRSTLAPARTGNGVDIENVGKGSSGDREHQLYNHMRPLVTVGQQVQAGDLIGVLDASGHQTGRHLHFETWTASGYAYDPQTAFDRWGVKVGSLPKRKSTPKPKPVRPKPKPPRTGSAKVRTWQERQNHYGDAGLYIDGVNGKVSKDWKRWTKKLQRALPFWRGIGKLVRDGDYAGKTHAAGKTLQRNNHLLVDGFIDTVSIRYMRANGSSLPYRPDNRP